MTFGKIDAEYFGNLLNGAGELLYCFGVDWY